MSEPSPDHRAIDQTILLLGIALDAIRSPDSQPVAKAALETVFFLTRPCVVIPATQE